MGKLFINVTEFNGEIPKVSAKRLPNDYAQTAQNCDFREGTLKPLKDLAAELSLSTTAAQSIYKHNEHWLYWNKDVDVVRSLVNIDTDKKKVIYTGDGYPKQTTSDLMTANGTPSDTTGYRRLGVTAPTAGLEVEVINTGDGVVIDTVTYTYTYVVQWPDGSEEESAPVDSVTIQDVTGGQYVRFKNFVKPTLYASGNDVTHFRVYRSASGNTTSEFQACACGVAGTGNDNAYTIPVTSVPNAETYVYDCTSTKDCIQDPSGIVIQVTDYTLAPAALKDIQEFMNGILIGFTGNELWISEPFIPYVWSEDNMLTFGHPIVGVGVTNGAIIVTTESEPYIVTGYDPTSLTSQILPYKQACLSKRGIVSTEFGVIYPCPDGLFLVNAATGKLLTEGVYTKEQWQALTPANLISFYYDRKYYGFFKDTGTGFCLNLSDTSSAVKFNIADVAFKGGFVEPETDTLHLVLSVGTAYSIKKFEQATTSLTAIWKSKVYEVAPATSIPFAKVTGNHASGTCTLKVYADTVLKHTQTVTSDEPFRLPSGFRARKWEFQLETTREIDTCALLTGL